MWNETTVKEIGTENQYSETYAETNDICAENSSSSCNVCTERKYQNQFVLLHDMGSMEKKPPINPPAEC